MLNPYNYYPFHRKTLNKLLKKIGMFDLEKRRMSKSKPKSLYERLLYTLLLRAIDSLRFSKMMPIALKE